MSEKKRILLHICCAPCAVYVIEKLKEDYLVTGFFSNSNIHPEEEYRFREEEIRKLAELKNIDLYCDEYNSSEWYEAVKGLEDEPEKGKRCSVCFHFRFRKAFEYASEKGFDAVASTLSISPYKSTPQINREGEALSAEFGVDFVGENFKSNDGFVKGRKMSAELGMYHQNYCGCSFSLEERERRINS